MRQLVIRSGGQTGVDRAALDAAIASNVPYAGWCPRGGLAEDLPSAPGLLSRYPSLVETPSAEAEQRTAWNVRDSDATLILVRGGKPLSPGTDFTRRCAELFFLKPWRLVDLDVEGSADQTREWLKVLATRSGSRPLELNVAGPRESQSPGIYDRAYRYLTALLRGEP